MAKLNDFIIDTIVTQNAKCFNLVDIETDEDRNVHLHFFNDSPNDSVFEENLELVIIQDSTPRISQEIRKTYYN